MHLLTDLVQELQGKIMIINDNLCRFLEIDMIRITSYRFQTNAFAEQFHKSVISIIALVTDGNRNLDTLLPMAHAVYRASIHSSTNFSEIVLFLIGKSEDL